MTKASRDLEILVAKIQKQLAPKGKTLKALIMSLSLARSMAADSIGVPTVCTPEYRAPSLSSGKTRDSSAIRRRASALVRLAGRACRRPRRIRRTAFAKFRRDLAFSRSGRGGGL